jgi:hypothetical protein
MIKIGENVIVFTNTEYGVEHMEPLVSLTEPVTTWFESRSEAEEMVPILNGTLKSRTVYTSEWRDAK